jgi:hypothetical protein
MDRFFQRHTLWLTEQHLPVMACFPHLAHLKLLSWATSPFERLALPILIVNVHKGGACVLAPPQLCIPAKARSFGFISFAKSTD